MTEAPPPVEVGSLVEFVARLLGPTLRYTYELVELVPGQRLAARSELITLRNDGEPAGFSKLIAPIMKLAMRRARLRLRSRSVRPSLQE